MNIARIGFAAGAAALAMAAAATAQAEHAAPAQGAAEIAADVPAELEVKRAPTGHLLVRPVLNGKPAGWFIFDTGAGICVISTPVAGNFELEPSAVELAASGVGGQSMQAAVQASTLQLGPVTLHDVPLMQTDLSFLREHLGDEIAGVIGYGLLCKCIVEVDLATPRIALHDPAKYTLAAGEWAPLALERLIPTVSATFEGREGRFHLDIGSNTGLTFQAPTVKRLDLLAGRELKDCKIGGVGGFVAAKDGRVAWLELAGVRLADVPATFLVEDKGAGGEDGRDGSIGTKVLESFLLTLDYAGERIAFRPREAQPAGG